MSFIEYRDCCQLRCFFRMKELAYATVTDSDFRWVGRDHEYAVVVTNMSVGLKVGTIARDERQ